MKAEFKLGDYVRVPRSGIWADFTGRVVAVVIHPTSRQVTFNVRHVDGLANNLSSPELVIDPDGERDEWIAQQSAQALSINTQRAAQQYSDMGHGTVALWRKAWYAKKAETKLRNYYDTVEKELAK